MTRCFVRWCGGPPASHDQASAAALAQLRRPPAAVRREALDEPLRAFPSWFLRIICDRCGKERMIIRDARGARRHADPRHHRPHAARRLRRQGGEGGAAHRHRGRQQPAGAADRADRRLIASAQGQPAMSVIVSRASWPSSRRAKSSGRPIPPLGVFPISMIGRVISHWPRNVAGWLFLPQHSPSLSDAGGKMLKDLSRDGAGRQSLSVRHLLLLTLASDAATRSLRHPAAVPGAVYKAHRDNPDRGSTAVSSSRASRRSRPRAGAW